MHRLAAYAHGHLLNIMRIMEWQNMMSRRCVSKMTQHSDWKLAVRKAFGELGDLNICVSCSWCKRLSKLGGRLLLRPAELALSALADALKQMGYEANPRMAVGGGGAAGAACLQNLCHRYVSCSVQGRPSCTLSAACILFFCVIWAFCSRCIPIALQYIASLCNLICLGVPCLSIWTC